MDEECAPSDASASGEHVDSERRDAIEKMLGPLAVMPDRDLSDAAHSIERIITAVTDQEHWYNWEQPGRSGRQLSGIASKINSAALADQLCAAALEVEQNASFAQRLEGVAGRTRPHHRSVRSRKQLPVP
jgi:hypothetical protein